MTVGELQVVAVVQTKAEPHLQVLLWEDAAEQPLPAVRKQQAVQQMDRNTQAVTAVAVLPKVVVAAVLVTSVAAAEITEGIAGPQTVVAAAARDISIQLAVH
jgi:hypothetical protein